jgi:hypothetical protein
MQHLRPFFFQANVAVHGHIRHEVEVQVRLHAPLPRLPPVRKKERFEAETTVYGSRPGSAPSFFPRAKRAIDREAATKLKLSSLGCLVNEASFKDV